jgi:hypothetical protein
MTPATCLSVLAEHGLLPRQRHAIYLAGSLIRGWGNDTSDLDVYVVTDSLWRGDVTTSSPVSISPGAVPVNAFYVADRRWDVEYWSDRQVDELLDSLSWEAFDAGRSPGGSLTSTEVAFVHRLAYHAVVEGEEWIDRRRRQFDGSAIRTVVAAQNLYWLDHLTEDAVGMRRNADLESAVIAARLALGLAVDALLASHGELETQAKWRARRMRAVLPPEVPFDEYWDLETMRSYDRDAPEKWVDEALRFCQRIVAMVQL